MKREHGKIFDDADSIADSATTSFPGSLSYLSRSVGTVGVNPGNEVDSGNRIQNFVPSRSVT